MAKLQSNHRLYNSDIKPDIDHSNTNHKNYNIQTRQNIKEATHSYSSFAFPEVYSL